MKTFLLIMLFAATTAIAQQYPASQKELEEVIIALDSEAFNAYNKCDLEKFETFFTEDLEFYHDKNGVVKGSANLMETMKKGMCNRPDWKLRREAVVNTFQVYPLMPYGAILMGEHKFYVTENGTEKLSGTAKFTHVWLFKDGKWKMSRVLSFDHREAN